MYLARLSRDKPAALTALLASRHNGSMPKWTQLVIKDLESLRERVAVNMPVPLDNFEPWTQLMSLPEWKHIVAQLFYTHSVIDTDNTQALEIADSALFSCSICVPSVRFCTEKGLLSHMRSKHGHRNPFVKFLDCGSCPVCRTDFETRERCMGHLSDKRRPKCRSALLSGNFPIVPDDIIARLDDEARARSKKARKAGHSHAIAVNPARTANGRILGHVTAAPPRCD